MPKYIAVPDKEKNFQDYILFVLAAIWCVTIIVIVSAGFLYFPDKWLRWLTFIVICTLLFATLNVLINKRKITQGSWLFITVLCLLISLGCLSSGGIKAPGVISQVNVILTAGFLLGWKGGVGIALLTVVFDFGMAWMETTGKMPQPAIQHTPISYWIAAIIPFGTITAIQYYATNHLRLSLQSMEREIKRREAAEKESYQTLYALNERMKELRGLFTVSQLLQIYEMQPDTAYQKIVDSLPLAWQFSDHCAARLVVDNKEYCSSNFVPSDQRQYAEVITNKGTLLSVEVVYIEPMPEADEGPFLKEERELINLLADLIKNSMDRSEQLQELNDYKNAINKATIVAITDAENRFSFVNSNFCAISQYSAEELKGQDWSIIASEATREKDIAAIEKQLKEGKYFRGEFCNKAKDGSLYWLDTTIVPFHDKNGKVIQLLSIMQDISERKKAEAKIIHSEQLLRNITSHVPVNTYMFKIDDDGSMKILFMNRGIEPHSLTPSAETVLGNADLLLKSIHEEDRPFFIENLQKAKQEMCNVSLQYRRVKNGITLWRWFQAFPVKDSSGETLWYGATSDITPLVDHILSVEQFLFDMGHVMRRPIANLIGLARIINSPVLNDDEMKKVAGNILVAANEMDKFVRKLNEAYYNKKTNDLLNIDFSTLVDQRNNFFLE